MPLKSDLRNKVFLSVELGDVLRPLLFSGGRFNEELITFLQIYKKQKQRIEYLLKKKIIVTNLNGVVSQIDSSNIRLEVSRNPILSSGIEHSYYSSISYCSSILEEFLEFGNADDIDCTLIEKATLVIRKIEESFRLHFQPVPRCLSFKKNYKPLFETERETPPLIHLPKVPIEKIGRGIYVSVSGIAGLRPRYEEAFQLPHMIFTNDRSRGLSENQIRSPEYIGNSSVNQVFSRAAWNTIWLANLTGTPLVCPTYTQGDDPEIFFNLKSVFKMNLAYIWDSQNISLNDFLSEVPYGKQKSPKIYEEIQDRFGTLDGLSYCGDIIVEDFLNAG